MTARPFLESWSESTVKYSNVNINNYDSSIPYAVSKTYNSSPQWWEYGITAVVQAWKSGSFNGGTYGMIFINSNESSSTYYRNFLSTEYTNSNYYPYITMSYTPSIVVSPSTKTLCVGQTCQLSATTCPGGISYTWFSMDPQIATVSSTGIVTAVSPGTAYIVANGGSNGSGTCVVTVVDFTLNKSVISFVVWDDFELIYKNDGYNDGYYELDYDYPQAEITSSLDECIWAVTNNDAIDIIAVEDTCYVFVNDEGEGSFTISCRVNINNTNITKTCTVNVVRITPNDIHVRLLKTNNSTFGTNETVTINNDTSSNSYDFNAQIYATKNGATYYLSRNEFVSFYVSECRDENGYNNQELYEHVNINSNTGIISVPSQANDTSGYAHPTGVATLCAKCSLTGMGSIYASKNVNVVCDDFGYSVIDDQVTRKKARYILVNHALESSNGSFDDYSSFGAFENIFDTSDEVEYRDNDFYEDDDEILREYVDYQNPINTYFQKLFSLIRNSEYCTIFTHGSSTGLLMSSYDNTVIFDVNMINSLHKGYFNPCTLVFLKACSTNAYAPGTTPNGAPQTNLVSALLDKGVGAVIAFNDSVFINVATHFEQFLYANLASGSFSTLLAAYNQAITDYNNSNYASQDGIYDIGLLVSFNQ